MNDEILSLDLALDNVGLDVVVNATTNGVNYLARNTNWGKGLYARFKETVEGEIMRKLIIITDNCDVVKVCGWDTNISIKDAASKDWQIYRTIIG